MSTPDRFEPHASRAMASMFDDVSGRYDLLNRLMTLGQDGVWREAMWRGVPESARVVLDLCTGSGVSLPGLRRPGRTVLGVDVSFAMLEVARDQYGGPGWAPRVACADAFRLPLRDGGVDAVTVAFGVRNLRPRPTALAEIARVLSPGGVLSVLEAAAPAPGPLAAGHAFWLRHMVPLLGRLSPDPSAYRYLRDSIFEFGAGPEFERDLDAAGFDVIERRGFLLGATRLWVARKRGSAGQSRAIQRGAVQDARSAGAASAPGEPGLRELAAGAGAWRHVQLLVSAALTAGLAWTWNVYAKLNADLPLSPPQRSMGWWLVIGGTIVFGLRTLWFLANLRLVRRRR